MQKKIKLIQTSYTTDSIGQKIPTITYKEVFADIDSIGSKEFYDAGTLGLNPKMKFKIWAHEYSDEEAVQYDGENYSIYRTYKAKDNRMELYVEKKAGV